MGATHLLDPRALTRPTVVMVPYVGQTLCCTSSFSDISVATSWARVWRISSSGHGWPASRLWTRPGGPATRSIAPLAPSILHTDSSLGLPTVHSNAYNQGNHHAPPPPPQHAQGFGQGAPQGYTFQYSACTGRRKALLIGINYFGQRGQLRGCINDVKNMSGYLNQNFGYAREDMVTLTDDQQNQMSQPTKQNILRAMHWLVKDAQPNDSLFFHYSGETCSDWSF